MHTLNSTSVLRQKKKKKKIQTIFQALIHPTPDLLAPFQRNPPNSSRRRALKQASNVTLSLYWELLNSKICFPAVSKTQTGASQGEEDA